MVKRRDWNVATNRGRSVRGLKGRPVGQDIMFPDVCVAHAKENAQPQFLQSSNKAYNKHQQQSGRRDVKSICLNF